MPKSELTLGSLFDGLGGFPLGGLMCGIKPIWASEIERFGIRVTTKRLPCCGQEKLGREGQANYKNLRIKASFKRREIVIK